MTKAELEGRVKELEEQVSKLKQDIKDIGFTADAYEQSALRHAALLCEFGKTFDKTNFSELLDKQLAMSTSIKPVKDNKALEIIKNEINSKYGKIPGDVELFKGEKRGVFGCIFQSGSVYGGYVCAIYRVSAKNKTAELAYRQSSVPTKDTALLCLDLLMDAANEERYKFSLFFDDEFKEFIVGQGEIYFPGEILEMYRAPKGYYSIITFGGMDTPQSFEVHTFRERYNTVEDLYTDDFKSLYDARCSMSDVIDTGLSFLRDTYDW
ncbi:MAG: hypothetical protein NC453_14530 [Muribaculum sp.]|nr:hypothetical protein [Muribaculum sp.]